MKDKPAFEVTDDELRDELQNDAINFYWQQHMKAICEMAAASDIPMTINLSSGAVDLEALTAPEMKGTKVSIHIADPVAFVAPGNFEKH